MDEVEMVRDAYPVESFDTSRARDAARQKLFGAIAAEQEKGRGRSRRRLSSGANRRGLVAAVGAAVVICAGLGGGLYAVTAGGGSSPMHGHPLGLDPLSVSLSRTGSGLTGVSVVVQAPIANATLELEVVQSQANSQIFDGTNGQVVYQEQLSMNDVAGPAGSATLSRWSGDLNPSDWTGGCQTGWYTVRAVVVPAGANPQNPPNGSQIAEAPWFTCSSS